MDHYRDEAGEGIVTNVPPSPVFLGGSLSNNVGEE